jgi:hypothetical protein
MAKFEPHVSEGRTTPRQWDALALRDAALGKVNADGTPFIDSWSPHVSWQNDHLSIVLRVWVEAVPTADKPPQWALEKRASRYRSCLEIRENGRKVLEVEKCDFENFLITTFRRGKSWEDEVLAFTKHSHDSGDKIEEGPNV